jgi:F0F1-type ATP synthase membrane subunit c/vacuolar-type H+-ATPase subunit K
LIVTVPTLKAGACCGGGCGCCSAGGGTWAEIGVTAIASNPKTARHKEATLRTGLLMEVFKACDVS